MTEIYIKNDRTLSLEWSITISDLKIGFYQALLTDETGTVLHDPWTKQRTDDGEPDVFPMHWDTMPPEVSLDRGHLSFDVFVIDPAKAGGKYAATVSIIQDGVVMGSFVTDGIVPPGEGAHDTITEEIRLLYAPADARH